MELNELYQELIVDHGTHPRNYQVLSQPSHTAKGFNPLCGDQITVYLEIKEQTITNITFNGHGCAISTASASIMTEELQGKSIDEAIKLFGEFTETITGNLQADLGKLTALTGVRKYPSRVKCATLAWHTLKAAILKDDKQITTE